MEPEFIKTNLANYNTDLSALLERKTDFLVLYKGEEDSQGKSWCSDCVAAKPNIKAILYPTAKQHGLPILIVNCGSRPEWKDKTNPVRTHPKIKASSVPTINLVKEGAVDKQIAEEDLVNEDIMKMLLEDD